MNELWALPFEMAEQVLSDLASAKSNPQARVEGFPERKARGYELVGGVAVIPVTGPIVREQGWYGVGQDAVASSLKAALADPSARAILFDITSPGGVVAGTKELADAIAEARTKKRCAAYANGLCASAAYWLASATGTVYAPLTATVGSVGVIMSVANYSKLNEKWGVSYTYITGGKWKAVGNGDTPLTDEERQYLQERITALHQIFKADVGRHMGLTADPQLWGEAQLLLAQPARELGLVTDIVRDRDAAIRKLAVEAQMTREELAAQSPELVDALLAEGRLKAEAENKANMDKAAADAVAGALAVVKAVAGDETASRVETTLNTFRATGMSAEQIATVAPLLAKAEAPVHENAEAKTRADILAGLQNVHQNPVAAAPGTVPSSTGKSPLLADAERRAEAAK
ncbi:S49 family peptidase [Bilophila wadsworthia]|uniref:S49 family peptidase n=2 Tax=Bilophila wadsworthia TaxID=35833 RepID=UPI00267605DD|nr:S49 family peptidase [Bilophila wadsworthia]